jgi:HAD superfamily hydrolase (TIGR01509 family)
MLRAILWDNDGVLVDTERIFFEANREYFRRHQFELDERQFFDWFLAQDGGAWHWLAGKGMSPAELAACRRERDQLYMARLRVEENLMVPGVRDVLARLQPRMRMGIVTSSRREHFDEIHRRLDLAGFFEFALTAESYARAKPAPDPYVLGLQKLSLSAAECVAIEDAPRGLEAAKAAGIRCIVRRTPLTRDCPFDGAYRVVDSMEELAEAIDRMS